MGTKKVLSMIIYDAPKKVTKQKIQQKTRKTQVATKVFTIQSLKHVKCLNKNCNKKNK